VGREELRDGAEDLELDFDEHVAFVIGALEERSAELELDGNRSAAA
jgi:predicted hydrolase (HD superfamily)